MNNEYLSIQLQISHKCRANVENGDVNTVLIQAIGPNTEHPYKENRSNIYSMMWCFHPLFGFAAKFPPSIKPSFFHILNLIWLVGYICLVGYNGYICLVRWLHFADVGLAERLPILIQHRFPGNGGIGAENWPIQREIGGTPFICRMVALAIQQYGHIQDSTGSGFDGSFRVSAAFSPGLSLLRMCFMFWSFPF